MKAANYQTSLSNWQIELANAITDPRQLIDRLALNPELYKETLLAHQDFPLRVPQGFLDRMEKGNPDDPLLLQVLPQGIELQKFPGYSCDPLQENGNAVVPGLLHKYHDRALLIVTGACAVHCRYCFRRHFPYEGNRSGWEAAFVYLRTHPDIKEVILSGGDPLTVKDNSLFSLLKELAAIPHIKRVRIHSRMPVVLPQRITTDFIEMLTATRLKPVMVIHCNHSREIDATVATALQRLVQRHIPLFNQAVLLKGVNDSVAELVNLSEALFAVDVMPYYLHLLDKVEGAAHFAVPEEKAKELVWKMMQRLSGYLVPKLVREVPGLPAKMPITIL